MKDYHIRVTTGTGISALTLLTVVFVVLKLCGVIAWSWWWVLVPLWGSWALCAAICIIVAICYLISLLVKKIKARMRYRD